MLDISTAHIFDSEDSGARPADPAAEDAAILDAYSHAVIGVADRVGPAVVRVETQKKDGNGRPAGGVGSGVILSPDGLVLTNSHVVEGGREFRLTDSEGRVMEARLLGEDPDTDLALLRADSARNLPSAALGDSKALPAGGCDRQSARL
jgi:S1-C subfamily serine protease